MGSGFFVSRFLGQIFGAKSRRLQKQVATLEKRILQERQRQNRKLQASLGQLEGDPLLSRLSEGAHEVIPMGCCIDAAFGCRGLNLCIATLHCGAHTLNLVRG